MKKLINLLLILSITSAFAQNYKFGKISEQELKETSNPKDPEAHATILYANEKVYFQYIPAKGFVVVTEVQKRIKIYDKDGVDWATEKVAFYDPDSSEGEELTNLKGYTYFLKNGEMEKVKLDRNSVFKEQTNKYWKQLKFTMPNISDGCVIEFQYRKESPYISIDELVLQYDIPVKKMEVEVLIPEYFIFNKYANPRAKYQVLLSESTVNRSETVNYKSREGLTSVTTTYDQSKWEFKETVYKADLEDIPALKQEPFIDNMDVYRCKIDWEYAMYKGPDGRVKSYSTTWEDVTKTINDHENFGGQLSKTGYFEKDIDALVANVSDASQRISLIYNFVKSKVAWNEYFGEYTDKGVRKAYKEGMGNVADINLMLTSMLRYAGLNANPVLISTKSNGTPLFPTRNGFNYVIAAVELPNKIVLLDATERYAMPDILPSRAINWQGRIVRERGSSAWISMLQPAASVEISGLQVQINDDLSAEGRARVILKDVAAMTFRKEYGNMGIDERIQDMEEGKGEIEISDYIVKNEDELDNPAIQYTYSYKLDNAVEAIGNKLYVTPLMFLATKENIFKQESREYPLEFIYPKSYSYTVTFMLPEGYKVERLPESAKVQFNGEEAAFSYLVNAKGNMVIINARFDVNSTFVLEDQYPDFKTFFGMMVKKQSEKMILVKEGPVGTE